MTPLETFSPAPVTTAVAGPLLIVALNRPQAINSLNLAMIRLISAALDEAERDDAIRAVYLYGEGPRGFASGADVKWLRSTVLEGKPEDGDQFFKEEYALDWRIHRFPKPIVALIDGVTMGGGLGLAIGARYRIATERTRIAMPETLIGFFPDVGATWFLNQLPGAWGTYLALTAAEIDGVKATRLGIATHCIQSGKGAGLPGVIRQALEVRDSLASAFGDTMFTLSPQSEETLREERWIHKHFSLASLDAIFASLREAERAADAPESEWARATLAKMSGSPAAMATTFRMLRERPPSSLDEAFEREYEAARAAIRHPDYAEGIRARLVDKDFAPRWSGV
jgi:enoyl-CoA hydratase